MDTDGRFVQSSHCADFPWRAIAKVAEHEDRALTSVEPIDGCREPRATLACEQPSLRIERAATRRVVSRFLVAGLVGGQEPALPPCARLPPIETTVDENTCKPHLERPGLAIGCDVAECLDEGILYGLVGF